MTNPDLPQALRALRDELHAEIKATNAKKNRGCYEARLVANAADSGRVTGLDYAIERLDAILAPGAPKEWSDGCEECFATWEACNVRTVLKKCPFCGSKRIGQIAASSQAPLRSKKATT